MAITAWPSSLHRRVTSKPSLQRWPIPGEDGPKGRDTVQVQPTWVIKCPHFSHHPTIRYMVCNGYYKVMSNIPKMGHLPIPDPTKGSKGWTWRGRSQPKWWVNGDWCGWKRWISMVIYWDPIGIHIIPMRCSWEFIGFNGIEWEPSW